MSETILNKQSSKECA